MFVLKCQRVDLHVWNRIFHYARVCKTTETTKYTYINILFELFSECLKYGNVSYGKRIDNFLVDLHSTVTKLNHYAFGFNLKKNHFENYIYIYIITSS